MTDKHIRIEPGSNGDAQVTTADGRRLITACHDDAGDVFSATELLLTALGTCIAASLAPLLQRHGHAPDAFAVDVRMTDDRLPAVLKVMIRLPQADAGLVMRCRRAAETCPLLKSLSTPVEIELTV